MNKRAFAEELALGYNLSVPEALGIIDAVFDTMIRTLVNRTDRVGNPVTKISVTGVGTFEVVKRAERFARNPQTGDRVKVNAVEVVRYRPGQAFADMVAGKQALPEGRSAAAKAPKTKKAAQVISDVQSAA